MEDTDVSSPAASLEGMLLTAMIDAHENRDIRSLDIPNAFTQAPMPEEHGEQTAFMKMTGPLAGILVDMHLEVHAEFVVHEKGKPVVCVWKHCGHCVACWRVHHHGVTNFVKIWRKKDSCSIHMIRVWQINQQKDHK